MAAPVICGIGLVTPLGMTAAATWDALLAGRAIPAHAGVDDLHPGTQPRINVLARIAAQQAIADANWDSGDLRDAALVVGTSKGPVQRWLGDGGQLDEEAAFGIADVAASLHLTGGLRLTVCAACASGLAALIRSAMMIRGGEARRVLVVTAESSLQPFFVGAFQRLGILADARDGCRPFDLRRSGFFLSEAAAAVCLQPAELGYARIERFALAGDATHLTASDPQGRTLRHLLNEVLSPPQAEGRAQRVPGSTPPALTRASVDLVHAHGTGTIANDALELAAIETEFSLSCGPAKPIVYSHKGALGHSLGAAGLVAVVLNCLMHRHGIIPPLTRTTQPMPANSVRFPPADRPTRCPVHSSIVLAAGFGGASAALRLQSTAVQPAIASPQ